MKRYLSIILPVAIMISVVCGCKKSNESQERLANFAKELNEGPNRNLKTGTILTGCEYNVGDTLFVYKIKVQDNRFDNWGVDSIKKNFAKYIQSSEMNKVMRLLNNAHSGILYKLTLPEKEDEISIVFTPAEITEISQTPSL